MREYLGGETPIFTSPDPKTKEYPFYSPYPFAGNTPIQAIDLDGAEPYKKGVINPSSYDDIVEHPIRSAVQNTSYIFASAFGINFIDDLAADLTDGFKGNKSWKDAGDGMLHTTQAILQSATTHEPTFFPPPSSDASMVLQTESGFMPLAVPTKSTYLTIPTSIVVLTKASPAANTKGGKGPNDIGDNGESRASATPKKDRVPYIGKSGATRLSDIDEKGISLLGEIKNNLNYVQWLSTQIKDGIEEAIKTGKTYLLKLARPNKITKPLKEVVRKSNGQVKIAHIDEPHK